ncbi:hypothetical protein [Ectopseudomonas composti]|uniref:hypothetical protein n=1 Tax=Ectopseudomonas composti TaxID=658457 RepID=UPI0018D21F73|nr:hypothetical protein [Pseudomonas composti]
MEINEALRLIQRLENLPEIYDQMERVVYAVMNNYYSEILEVELNEATVMANENYKHDELTPFIERKKQSMLNTGQITRHFTNPAHRVVSQNTFGTTL